MEKPNCEKCRYRQWLIKYGGPPARGKECDQYGQELCQKMNDPGFIKWVEERNGKDGIENR